jgi:hypothetical protein
MSKKIVLAPFAKKGTNDSPTARVNHNLTLEGMPPLFPRIEAALATAGTLNRRFHHVHHYDLRLTKSSY